MPTIEPEAVRSEARKWEGLASEMSTIRENTANLWLSLTAFFPGGTAEGLHYAKYRECLDKVVSRLEGAAVEFELVGITLRKIADEYEESDRVSGESFRVTASEVERAVETHVPPSRSGGGHLRYA